MFAGVLMLSSLFSVGYLMPIVARAFFAPPRDGGGEPGLREAPLLCVVPLCLTALGCIALFFGAEPILALLRPMAGD